MAKMSKKWVVLCSATIGVVYAGEYFTTDAQAVMSQIPQQTVAQADPVLNGPAPSTIVPSTNAQANQTQLPEQTAIQTDPIPNSPDQVSSNPANNSSNQKSPAPSTKVQAAQTQLPEQTAIQTDPVPNSPDQVSANPANNSSKQKSPAPSTKAQEDVQQSTKQTAVQASPVPSKSAQSSQAAANPSTKSPAQSSPALIQDSKTYKDGTYTGMGSNRRGNIQVAVTIKNDKIIDVEISNFGMHYSEGDVEGLPNEVLQKQSAQVNNVSGATYSTMAFRDAIINALSQAKKG